MDIFLLLIIAVLLGFILYNLEKLVTGHNPPLKYTPRKNSIMDADSDLLALYYTDMSYPVYGKEAILTIQKAYRNCTYKAFDLGMRIKNLNKEEEISHLTQEMYRITLKENLKIMMQSNLDVFNGKVSIEEARRQTEDTVEINNALLPPLASRQIAIDVHANTRRPMYEYTDFNLLNKLNKERQKHHE